MLQTIYFNIFLNSKLCVEHRITKQYTRLRQPMEPGLKLAVMLRHLASVAKYSQLQYGCCIPPNSLSIVVREVCQAICDKYMDELMKPRLHLKNGKPWQMDTSICGTSQTPLAPWTRSMLPSTAKSGSLYYNNKGFYSIVLMASVSSDNKFIWADLGGKYLIMNQFVFN